MITLTLDWHEVLWWLQGAMSGSHLRWSAYEDMVNRVWPQCTEQERRNIFFIMRRDLGSWWRPKGFRGDDPNLRGEGPWRADDDGYAIDCEDADGQPVKAITDLTPWMYFRQVLARFNPEAQYAVTLQADSRKLADTVWKDARQRGILVARDGDYNSYRNPKGRTVTVRTYQWQKDYRIDWDKRCDPDRIVKVEHLEVNSEE